MNSRRLNAITHLHTFASNGPASSLDQMAKSIIAEILGRIPKDVTWRECFTCTEDIENLLAGKKTHRSIDIIFLTDHMSSRHHKVNVELRELAIASPRIGIGCEIQTVSFSRKDDCYLNAPEVLIYGGLTASSHNGRKYTGIDDALLEELYNACVLPGASEPDIAKVAAFCRERSILCAPAHPFDCHQLDIEDTLRAIRLFDYVESVNGGFPKRTSNDLCDYLAFHNHLVEHGWPVQVSRDTLTPKQNMCVEQILKARPLGQIGGSDAHYNNFDRVITSFESSSADCEAQEFITQLLDASRHNRQAQIGTQIHGSGCSMAELYKDVVCISSKNLAANWRYFFNPLLLPRIVKTAATRGREEVAVRVRRNREISDALHTQLNIQHLHRLVLKGAMTENERTTQAPQQL